MPKLTVPFKGSYPQGKGELGLLAGIMNVAFLSTYPPRECGLATFTEDLVNGISKVGLVRPGVIAVGMEEYEDLKSWPRIEGQALRADTSKLE